MRVTIINQPNGETSFARVTITVRYPLRARLFSGCSHRLETTDVFLRLTASCANLSLCVRSRARQRVPRIHPSRSQKSHRRLSVARFPGCPRSRGNFAKSHFDGSRLVGLSPLQKKKQKRVQVARLLQLIPSGEETSFPLDCTDRFDRPISMKKSNHEGSIRTQKRTNERMHRFETKRVAAGLGDCGFLCIKSRAWDGLSLRGIRDEYVRPDERTKPNAHSKTINQIQIALRVKVRRTRREERD